MDERDTSSGAVSERVLLPDIRVVALPIFLTWNKDLRYAISEAKSLANCTWIQSRILSSTRIVPRPNLHPIAARPCATKLEERGLSPVGAIKSEGSTCCSEKQHSPDSSPSGANED